MVGFGRIYSDLVGIGLFRQLFGEQWPRNTDQSPWTIDYWSPCAIDCWFSTCCRLFDLYQGLELMNEGELRLVSVCESGNYDFNDFLAVPATAHPYRA